MAKERGISAAEFLQEAVHTKVRRQKLKSAIRRHTIKLAAEVGQPSPRQLSRAVALSQRIYGH